MNKREKGELIVAKDIVVEFKSGDETVTPLKGISFTLDKNSFNIIYGPSGSGKSTLLNVLTGLQRPTEGSVVFNKKSLYELKPKEQAHFRANDIGFVYQTNYWIKSLNVIENVSMPLYFLGYSRGEAAKLAKQALERVNMGEYTKRYPVMLSGGEQQRIAMARALAHDPSFIIADEPTGSLDTETGSFIMGLLEKYKLEYGKTVILVTHNIEFLPFADRLLHIEDGKVRQMTDKSIQQTADTLLREMRMRIYKLTEKNRRGRKI